MNKKIISQIINDLFYKTPWFGIAFGMFAILIMKEVFNN